MWWGLRYYSDPASATKLNKTQGKSVLATVVEWSNFQNGRGGNFWSTPAQSPYTIAYRERFKMQLADTP